MNGVNRLLMKNMEMLSNNVDKFSGPGAFLFLYSVLL